MDYMLQIPNLGCYDCAYKKNMKGENSISVEPEDLFHESVHFSL